MKTAPKLEIRAYKILAAIISLLLAILVLSIFAPNTLGVALNFIWFFFLTVVIAFLGVGVLVVFGLRTKANKLLDLYVDGSLTLVEFVGFIRDFIEYFVFKLKELILILTPLLAYISAFLIYYILLLFYKWFGSLYDVTVLTVFLTIFLVTAISLLTLFGGKKVSSEKWLKIVRDKFKTNFIDALEIVLLIFFLTMDSTTLLIIPENLRAPLTAEVFGHDLMVRGYSLGSTRVTITLIMIGIVSEIIRYSLAIVVTARNYYFTALRRGARSTSKALKNAVSKSFNQSREDIVRFITYTTVLLFVFMWFPRLKLLTFAIGSVTMLSMDIIFPKRLVITQSNDLFSRMLNKVFKL